MVMVKTRAKGGPNVKTVATVFCRHCFNEGKSLEIARCVKKNLPRHNRRFHPELNPLKDQAWMLAQRGSGRPGSGSSANGASYGLGSFFKRQLAVPIPAAEQVGNDDLSPENSNENSIENFQNYEGEGGLEIHDEEKRSCRKRERHQPLTISQAFGAIPILQRTLERINDDIDQVNVRCDLSEEEKADGLLWASCCQKVARKSSKLREAKERI